MVSFHGDNFKSALFYNLADVLIPPTAVMVRVSRGVSIKELVQPLIVTSAVFQQQYLAVLRISDTTKVLQ